MGIETGDSAFDEVVRGQFDDLADATTAIVAPVPSMAEVTLTLEGLGHGNAGWCEIRDTSTATLARSGEPLSQMALGTLVRGARKAKPVRSAAVAKDLMQLAPESRPLAEATITHTVAFAKNVLEAERDAHFRVAIHGFDTADRTITGPHAAVKERAESSYSNHSQVEKAISQVIAGREKLPVDKPDGVRLHVPNLALFHGLAELYGMARAGYDPSALPQYLYDNMPPDVNQRTRNFLRYSSELVASLRGGETPEAWLWLDGQAGPVAWLDTMCVSVPAAMEIADSPSEGTIMAVARRIAEAYQ